MEGSSAPERKRTAVSPQDSSSFPNGPSPPNHDEDFASLTLNEWLSKFGRIYGKRHEKHTTEYMISRLVEEVAELVNPMESQDKSVIAPSLADVFSWICSLAYKLKIDLAELAWQKYGRNAPRPAWSSSSSSQPSLADFSQPQTLRDWQNFISQLYQTENARITPMNALIAMMKDVGDVSMLQRKRASQDQITSKIAAILAWTLTISQLLHLDLAEVVYSKYDDHCPLCLQRICDTDVCHPFATMYVSFGGSATDEEKYVILDSAAKFGFRTLVNTAPSLQATKDVSTSLDLINNSDAACILLSPSESSADPMSQTLYRQIFETLACFSVLSKGNVWVFTKDPSKAFSNYLSVVFGAEKVDVPTFMDPNHLRALFESKMEELASKRDMLTKRY